MKTVTIAIIVLAAALWLMADVEPANACSCARSGSPKEALAQADAVFAGKAIAVQLLINTNSSADPVTVSFDVNRVWKGPRQDTIVITTERSGISCGYEFKEGRRYFVYAHDGETGLCTRTRPVVLAPRDFAELGPGWHPSGGAVPDGSSGRPGVAGIGIALAVIATIAALSGWRIWRRARRRART